MGFDLLMNGTCVGLMANIFARAGCGKSARPVRRGESKSRDSASLTLLLYRLCVKENSSLVRGAFLKAMPTQSTVFFNAETQRTQRNARNIC